MVYGHRLFKSHECIREWLVNFDDSREAGIRFDNNMNVPLKGVGDILIKNRHENQALITSVLYVSSMTSNLLSTNKFS